MVQVKGRRVGGAVAPASGVARLPWVDNLKIGVIAGVVVAHAATAYVVDIDWYYQERTTSGLWQALLSLAMLDAVFVLGPLFLLGGVFAAASLARRGPGGFVHGRLLRLGVPLLLFVAVLSPLTNYLGDVAEGERPGLWPYLAPGGEDQDAGPLWFVAALLTFSLVYAAWRWFRPAGSGSGGGAAAVAIRHQRRVPRSQVGRVAAGRGAVHPRGALGPTRLAWLGPCGLVAPLCAGRCRWAGRVEPAGGGNEHGRGP
jgi:hypothetical protein